MLIASITHLQRRVFPGLRLFDSCGSNSRLSVSDRLVPMQALALAPVGIPETVGHLAQMTHSTLEFLAESLSIFIAAVGWYVQRVTEKVHNRCTPERAHKAVPPPEPPG